MLEWLTMFGSNYRDTLIVSIAGTTIGGLILAFLIRLFLPDTEQQRRRRTNKLERLKARLERHRNDQRILGFAAIRELFYFLAYTTYIACIILVLLVLEVDDVIALSRSIDTGTLEPLAEVSLFYPFSGILAWLTVWVLTVILTSLRRTLRLLFPDWADERLVSCIKKLDSDWEDRKS